MAATVDAGGAGASGVPPPSVRAVVGSRAQTALCAVPSRAVLRCPRHRQGRGEGGKGAAAAAQEAVDLGRSAVCQLLFSQLHDVAGWDAIT